MLKKSKKADLKSKYTRYVEISLILALSLMIAAFKYFPEIQSGDLRQLDPQILISAENVIPTQQNRKPPEPPKPDPIVEVVDDDIPIDDDIEFQPTEIDITGDIKSPPKYFRESEKEEVTEVPYFELVETMPAPIGGIAGIQSKIVYPEFAVKAGIQGKVYVMAYVNTKGEVDKVELVKGIGMGCDEEALKAVSNTTFFPGKQRGKPVPVKVMVPIKFVIRR